MNQGIEIKAPEERIDLLGETADELPKPSYWLSSRSINRHGSEKTQRREKERMTNMKNNITLSMLAESAKASENTIKEQTLPKRFLEIREKIEAPDEVITDYPSILSFNSMRSKVVPGISLEATRKNYLALAQYLDE